MPDINIDNIEYSIEINKQPDYVIEFNKQGPQGATGPQGETGATGNGIANIAKTSTSGNVDVYTITYDNGDTTTFTVTNGNGIASIEKTSSVGLEDTYTITFDDGDTETFTITNGEDGVSPTATVTQTTSGATITITDAVGTTTADITNGTDGHDGQAATITVGTVTTGVAGSSASVTNSGTTSAAVLDFVIPRGDKGETGATGPSGADGQDGYSPTATVTKSGDVATITITDKNGTTTAEVYDGSGASSVSQLTDVELTNLTNGQGLLYNSTTQKWENANIQGGGGDITDVQVDGVSVVTGTVANITGLQPLLTSENAGDNISILNGEGGQETVSGNGTIVLEDAMADGLNSVTISGGLKRSLLPSGYTQYDYITATGTQYFVTDYYPNDKTEIETKTFLFKQPNAPMVARWTGSPTNDTFGFYMGNVSGRLTFFFGAYSNTKYLNVENVKTNIEHDIYMGVSSIKLDGTSYPITRSTFTSTQPLYIGAFNQTGTSLAGTLSGRIYPAKFIENGQVVRHYIPCANENNVIGLYEVVTGTFLENAGTGTLKKGRPYIGIDTIPDTYTRLDFLQATGTQYIDSGVIANFATSKIEQTATVQYTTSNTDRELMGTNGYGFWGKSASNKIEAALGQMTVTDNALVKNVISWTTNPDGNTLTLNVNDNQYSSTASSFVNDNYSYYVFALGIRIGSGSSASFLCHAKVWDYTIAVDDEVVCYLVPVRRNSDNVLGMYNVATGAFRANAGTGTFTAGSDVATPSPTNPLPIVSNNGQLKLGSHGKNLFNKDSVPYLTGAYISSATVGQSTYSTASNANYNVYRMEIKPNTTYTFGLIKANDPRWIVTDGSVILDTGTNGGGSAGTYKTITAGATAKYLYLSVAVTGSYKCDDVLQVEEGLEHTEYEAFHYILVADGITETITDSANNTATAEMLLSMGNYTDTQEILSGAVTRKVGVIVLNGTEDWGAYAANNGYRSYRVNNFLDADTRDAICTHLPYYNFSSSAMDRECVAIGGNKTTLYINLAGEERTVNDFKTWLAQQYANGTPVIVVYPLATETTETVTGQTLTTITGDNTLTISQASIDNLPIVANFDEQGGLLISFVNTNYATETWVENKGYALTSQLPTKTSDLTNDSGFVVNTATGSNSLTILGTAATVSGAINIGNSATASTNGYSVAIGNSAKGSGGSSVALGRGANSSGSTSVAVGRDAVSSGAFSIQLGKGTNSTANTFAVGFNGTNYQMLDGATGLIPSGRIPIDGSTITVNASGQLQSTGGGGTVDQTYDATSANAQSGVAIAGAGFITGITSSDVTTALGYTPYSASNPSGYITSSALNYRAHSIVAEPTTDGSYMTSTGTISTSDNNFNVRFLRRNYGKWEVESTYQLLSGATGLIPDARLSSNIARTANVADTDLSNVTDTGYIKMAGASMPSGTYDDLTLGASGAIYTAPSNGWFYFSKQGTAAGQQLVMGVKDTNNSTIYDTTCITATSANAVSGILPVKKGDRVEITYQTPGQLYNFRFIYAKGSESEAS